MDDNADSDDVLESTFFNRVASEAKLGNKGKSRDSLSEAISNFQIITHLMMAHCLKNLLA